MRNQENPKQSIPKPQYAYYRRCQEFRRDGEQCKAPAEKGSQICYAHAGQRAMAARREMERQVVLAIAAAKAGVSLAELLMSFDGIQVTIAAVAQTLISGRIDCKTAGRLLWELQGVAKLLRLHQRAHAINAQTTKDTKEHKGQILSTDTQHHVSPLQPFVVVQATNEKENARTIKPDRVEHSRHQGWCNGPPTWTQAA